MTAPTGWTLGTEVLGRQMIQSNSNFELMGNLKLE